MDFKGKERGILKLEPRPRVVIEAARSELTPQGSHDHPPCSPQPSVDRLSVTWADPSSMTSSGVNLFHLPSETPVNNEVKFSPSAGDGSEDEDYSASLSAVLRQRRASVRRSRKGRSRRPSSPFLQDETRSRRRSSVFTTSSGDTAISIEDTQPNAAVVSQEQIFENIHLHKEVLGSVKQQPLGMRRKLKIVHQAKAYIKRHEGQLQERLAQSKSTRDIYARFNILLASKWQQLKREAANTSNLLIPWELRIKEIESHFGSVVASYFTFLRWLFWVNLVIGFILLVFVIIPEYLTTIPEQDGERKIIMEEERRNATNLLTLWEFEGVLKCSPIFYGYYSNVERPQYRMPLAYFLTGLAVYIYSFVAILKKMAENSRMSKLSEKEDECIFSWKLFTGWDFMIGNTETAHNRIASVILGFKEALLEEAEKKRDLRNWRIISLRAIVNICVVILLAASAYAVVTVVSHSEDDSKSGSWWRENETTIVVTVISIMFPVFFELLGFLEHYHPRKQLRLQLARIMLLNLLNLYSLIFALFSKIEGMSTELQNLKPDLNMNVNVFNTTVNFDKVPHLCIEDKVECGPCEIQITVPILLNKNQNSGDIVSQNLDNEQLVIGKQSHNLVAENLVDETLLQVLREHAKIINMMKLNVSFENDTYDNDINNTDFNEEDYFSPIDTSSNDYETKQTSYTKPSSTFEYSTINSVYSENDINTNELTITSNHTNNENASYYDIKTDQYSSLSVITTPEYNTITDNKPNEDTWFDGLITSEHEKVNVINKHYKPSDLDNNTFLNSFNESITFSVKSNDYEPELPEVAVNVTENIIGLSNDFFSIVNDVTENTESTMITFNYTYLENETNLNTDGYNSMKKYIESEGITDNDIKFTIEDTSFTHNSEAEASTILNEDRISTDDAKRTHLFTSTSNAEITGTLLSKQNIGKKVNTTVNEITEVILPVITSNLTYTTPFSVERMCTNVSFNCTLNCEGKNITQVVSVTNCTIIKRHCYITKCGTFINKNGTNVFISNDNDIKKLKCKEEEEEHNKKKYHNRLDIAYKDEHKRTMYNLSMPTKKKLLKLCWETMFGQELIKLTMMDLVFVLLGTLFMDFFRALFVRYMNRCWCWDLEKKFPEYGDFKIAENILHLINNQGMVWMGMFFSPGLVVLNVVKLMVMMYLRSWAVMTCNVPHEVVFRVSKSNNFYLALLLTMLFLCVLPVGYTIVWVTPSWHCGPFSDYDRIYYIVTNSIDEKLPKALNFAMRYSTSPAIVIPLLVLLILIIYYLTSLTNSLREANNDLKIQLRRERTEERRKMFQLADTRRRAGSSAMDNTPFARWKKALPTLPLSKSIDSDDRKTITADESLETMKTIKKRGGIFAKIVGLALDKKTDTDGETTLKRDGISAVSNTVDDETDTDFHETLPKEVLKAKDIIIKHELRKKNSVEFKAISKSGERSLNVKLDKPDDKTEKKANIAKQMRGSSDEKYKSSFSEDNEVLNERKLNKKPISQSSTQSKQSDSIGSVIPVITISTTESDEETLTKKKNDTDNDENQKRPRSSDLKSLRRQSSVDSINEHKSPKEKKGEEGPKYQYSL